VNDPTPTAPSPARGRRTPASGRTAGPIARGARAVLLLAVAFGCSGAGDDSLPDAEVVFAVAEQPISSLIFLAHDRELFEAEGVTVELQPHATGRDALAAVLEGRADLGTTAETPVVRALIDGADVEVLASIASTRAGLRVFATSARVATPRDLSGARVGVTPGTNAEYYLSLFLAWHRIDPESVEILEVGPRRLGAALVEGSVDAVVSWQPHSRAIRERLGTSVRAFDPTPVYTWYWLLAAGPEFVRDRPSVARAVLASLVRAQELAEADTTLLRSFAAERFDLSAGSVPEVVDPLRFGVSLPQELLPAMEDQVEWMRGDDESAESPNVIEHLRPDPLERVDPVAVTLISPASAP